MADEPIYDLTTERMYHRLPETFRMADRGQGYALKRYVRGMCAVEAELDRLSARFDRLDVIEQMAKLDSPYSNYLRQHLVVQRTNLAPNPDFDAANGTVEVRRNLMTNPAFRATSGTSEIRRNLVTNPAMRAVAGTSEVRRNLVVNPAFRALNGTTEVRRNLIRNPSFRSTGAALELRRNQFQNPLPASVTHWLTGGGVVSYVATGGPTGAGLISCVNDGTAGVQGMYLDCPLVVAAGSTITASVDLRKASGTATGMPVYLRINYSDGTPFTQGQATFVTLDGNWQRASTTLAAVAGAAISSVQFFIRSTVAGVITFEAARGLVEVAGANLPYFDGSTVAANGQTFAWTGTANASASTATAPIATTWSANSAPVDGNAYTYPLGRTDSSSGAMYYKRDGNYGIGHFASYTPVVAPGDTYTASAYVYPIGQSISAYPMLRWRDGPIGASVKDDAAIGVTCPANQWTRVTLTATAPVGAASVFVQVSAAGVAGQIMLVDDVLLEKAGAAFSYMDGATAAASGLTYSWTGTVDNSESIATGNKPAGITSEAGAVAYVDPARGLVIFRPNGSGDIYLTTRPGGSIAAGTPVTISIDVVSGVGVSNTGLYGRWENDSSIPVQTKALVIGTRNSMTMPAPTVASTLLPVLLYGAGTPGEWVFNNMMVEKVPNALPYFDGATPAANSLTYAWIGTADASESVATGLNITGWGTYVGVSGDYQVTDSDGIYLRAFANGTSVVPRVYNQGMTIDANDGDTLTLSGEIRCAGMIGDISPWVAIRQGLTAGGEWLASFIGPVINGWTKFSITAVVPSGRSGTGVTLNVGVIGPNGGVPAGSTFDVRNVLVEKAAVVFPYFDGASAAAAGLTYTWTGAVDASQSIATGNKPVGITFGNGATGYVDPARGIVVHRPTISAYMYINPYPGGTISAGKPITVGFDVVSAPAFASGAFQMLWGLEAGTKSSGDLTAGQRMVSHLAAASVASNVLVYIIYPGAAAGDWVFNNVVVEVGATDGSYFDGNTLASNDLTYAWAGTVDASESTAVGNRVATLEDAFQGDSIWQGTFGMEKTAKIRNKYASAASAAMVVLFLPAGSMQQDDFVAANFKVRSLSGSNINIQFSLRAYQNVSGGLTYISDTISTTLPGNGDWVTINIPALNRAPATSGKPGLVIRAGIGGWNGSEVIEMDKMIVEKVDQAGSGTGEFFTGNSTPTHDNIYGWEGDPNLSFSTMSMMTAYTEDEEAALGWTPIDLTSDLVDPVTADAAWLNWLGQLVGVNTDTLLSEQERRDAVQFASSGFHAGSQTALEDAARSELTGTRYVRVYTHSTDDMAGIGTGTEWDILLVTKTSETPSVAQVVDTVIRKGAKPAGVRLYHKAYEVPWSISDTMDWDTRDALTWDEYEETGVV